MGDEDRIQFIPDGNIGREKETVDQFDGEVVQGEAPSPSGTNQLGINFDSSARNVDLHERSDSYLMFNNNRKRASRSWQRGVNGNQGGVDTVVPATSKRSWKMIE